LQFVVGGFYSDTHGRVPFAAKYPPSVIPGFAAASGFDLVVDDERSADIPESGQSRRDLRLRLQDDGRGARGLREVSYEFTDRLKATAGLRWYQIKTTAGGYLEGSRSAEPAASTRRGDKEDGVNPKFQVDYKLTPDHMVYAMAAKGFRPGGLVPSVPLSPALGCDVQLAAIGVTPTRRAGTTPTRSGTTSSVQRPAGSRTD
jgi:outer membrane receptor protein involved in Fe transport